MLNPQRDDNLLWLGAVTDGAVSLDECRAAGLSERRVFRLVEIGRWQALWPRTYVAFSGPIPAVTLRHAALLYAGRDATLSFESAGFSWGLCREPEAIHVTVPYAREVDAQPGLVVHRSRTLTHADCDLVASPRRTNVERTVLDLLAHRRTADGALGLVAAAIRQRRTTPDRLRAALEPRKRTRWRRVVLDALPDIRRGAQSPLELRDAQIRRLHGLPKGTRQVRRTSDGTEYLDVVIEDYGVHIELDGRLGHDEATQIWRDFRRDNRSEVQRLRHLRYGWADVVDRPCQVAAQQAEVLRQQGWLGPFRRCPDCPPDL